MRVLQFILFSLLFFINPYDSFSQNDSNDGNIIKLNEIDELEDSLQANILYELCMKYISTNPDSSIIFSDRLLQLADKNNNNYWRYRAYLQKGNALRIKGKLDDALASFFSSLKAAQFNNYKKGEGVVYTALGDSYATAKNQENSTLYYNKAINLFRELNDSIYLAITLLNIGGQCIDFQLNDEAIIFLTESKEIFELIGYNIGIAYNLGNLGRIYGEQGNYILAKNNLDEAISILSEIGDNQALISYKIRLAKLYQDQSNLEMALVETNQAIDIAFGANLLPQMRDASERLSLIYNDLGDYKNAYKYQSQYIAYRDSINNEETIRKMADLRTEYEVAQKQAEVEKAQTLLELETKRRQNQQIVGIGLMVVILLSGALSYLLFRNARRDRYINRLLREQKEELMSQRDMLEDVNNTKDRFFSIISHDLRGPIGVLNGTTMLIREFLESKDYAQLDDLTTNMEYSVKKVQNLLDNLLEWAVSQRGQYNYVAEKVELNQVMLETISIFSDMAQAKSIVISYEQKYSEAYITVDRNSLTTILRNLISNAIKFTNKCGVVDIVVEKGKSETQILVKDTGVGIPQDKLKTLFDIEAKKSTWGTAKEKGLGIGLNLVHEFVKMNKGTIQAKSTLGVGTTFIITFPTQHELVDAEKERTI